MKNLLALLGFAIVVVGGVGWYQGWYKISFNRNSDGTLRVQTDVNTTQAGKDFTVWGQKVENFVEQHLDKPPASTPGPTLTAPAVEESKAVQPSLKDGAGWLLGNVLGKEAPNK